MVKIKSKLRGEYQCVDLCEASYDSVRGLARHQGSCKILTAELGVNLAEAEASRASFNRKCIEDEIVSCNQTVNEPLADNHSDVVINAKPLELTVIESTFPIPMDVDPSPQALQEQAQQPDSINVAIVEAVHEAPTVTMIADVNVEEQPMQEEELGRGKRKKIPVQRFVNQHHKRSRRPRRYNDPQPDPPAPIPDTHAESSSFCSSAPAPDPAVNQASPVSYPPICRTEKNAHGLYREYFSRPTFVPDEAINETDNNENATVMDTPISSPLPAEVVGDSTDNDNNIPAKRQRSWYWPFLNATTYRLMHWFWNGSKQKSVTDLQQLVDQVLAANDFNLDDLRKFNAKKESARLDSLYNPREGLAEDDSEYLDSTEKLQARDGWKSIDIHIPLPDRAPHASEADAPKFLVSGLYYRCLPEVIKSAFRSEQALRYHYTPFKQFWSQTSAQSNAGTDQRIYDELYSSDVWYEAHKELYTSRQADDEYEFAIAGLMMWSDSTQLAQFGSASLWPIYMYFGNQSKYERCRPNSNACHHIAYLPELPDSISEGFRKISDDAKKPTDETLTHCRRELMHGLLAVLFDENFKEAYRNGILIKCADDRTRRVFPRIFTWSADYPEKVILASISYLSDHPCPRCLISKARMHELGVQEAELNIEEHARRDSSKRQSMIAMAREQIYKLGRGVRSVAVMALLGAQSLVPIFNTLSKLLLPFGVNFYELFVVDFLHEFELGVWKNTFIQLIQIVADGVPDGLSKLNERYRSVPTFGSDIIRRFTDDASAMTKLGARDFEDLLVCAMPVFEGLLPEEHNTIIMDLLFCLATWHGLGKLRMHTDDTIALLDHATRLLGIQLRLFKDNTCQAYETEELKIARKAKEKQKAARRKNGRDGRKRKAKATTKSTASTAEKRQSKKKKAKKRKVFCLNTYKTHALEHYTQNIRRYGAVDSYSTQLGELEHRRVKKYYARTNKNDATQQIARIERREYILRHIEQDDPGNKNMKPTQESLPFMRTDEHHHISLSKGNHIYLPSWLRSHDGDPAVQDFRNKLKDHLLRRLLEKDFDGDEEEYSEGERNAVQIEYNRLYTHKVIRVNHTTYDLRRSQDSMNPRTHSDIMVLAPKHVYKGDNPDDDDDDFQDENHPFWYARIIGIYHASIRHSGPQSKTGGVPQRMEFLWVRWFGQASNIPSGWSVRRLHAVQFVPKWNGGAFGFVDPSQVVRGVHLIPAFHHGRALARLTRSVACKEGEDEWEYYYVNSFVDRDMLMRYVGGGVGHRRIDLISPCNRQPLTSADLQPRVDAVHRDELSLASGLSTVLPRKEVNEEEDEVHSIHEDGEDSDSSTDEED